MLFLLPGSITPVPVTKSSSTAAPSQGNVTWVTLYVTIEICYALYMQQH